MKMQRILCPIDFSENSGHAVEQAVALAAYYKAEITTLHVLNPIVVSSEGVALDRLERETADFCEPARKAGIVANAVVDVGEPVKHILDRASSILADLIVIGTHGASGFQHLVLGSVTEKVLRRARCPVLTVPPRARATSRLPFERLLCAVDFSEPSIAAVQFALSLAQESRARLTLLHVLEWPWHEPPPPRIQELPPEQGRALAEFRRYSEDRATKRLESLVPDSFPTSQVTTTLRSGKPYVQILDVAADDQIDLIVIGIHGRNPVDLALFGSTTNQIVRRATCPVLTLR